MQEALDALARKGSALVIAHRCALNMSDQIRIGYSRPIPDVPRADSEARARAREHPFIRIHNAHNRAHCTSAVHAHVHVHTREARTPLSDGMPSASLSTIMDSEKIIVVGCAKDGARQVRVVLSRPQAYTWPRCGLIVG